MLQWQEETALISLKKWKKFLSITTTTKRKYGREKEKVHVESRLIKFFCRRNFRRKTLEDPFSFLIGQNTVVLYELRNREESEAIP